MNYRKNLNKIGFRKMKPTVVSWLDEEWVETPMYTEEVEKENWNPRDAREDFHFGIDPIMNTYKYVIDKERSIYINIARSGRYQVRLTDNTGQINFVTDQNYPFAGKELWFAKFKPGFWQVIVSRLDVDARREIRFKQLFKQSRKGTN
ncbi:MAG: hypothetical protein SLAVMIC_00222 [uncultured marine phage]|uniref:Uncharacterized protein n=1 Tax=uncultured marine phage TaxID=707152 RepID=A0A8D9FQW3_9VIRU|nr:MAG: hypothetical protein SLAVMIC_00222 [uncultured marine phage]